MRAAKAAQLVVMLAAAPIACSGTDALNTEEVHKDVFNLGESEPGWPRVSVYPFRNDVYDDNDGYQPVRLSTSPIAFRRAGRGLDGRFGRAQSPFTSAIPSERPISFR